MTAKPNVQRGEAVVELKGRRYRLVPSFENLAALEEAAGASLIDLATRLHQRTIRLSELATIIASTAEPEISRDAAGRALVEEGLVKVIGPVSKFLSAALLGGKEGNAKAAGRR